MLFSIIHFGCWIEYQKLVNKIDPEYGNISPFHKYEVMLAGWGFMLWMTNDAYGFEGFALKDAGLWMLVVGAIAVNAEVLLTRKFKLLAHSFWGLVYISLSLGLLVSVRSLDVLREGIDKFVISPGLLLSLSVILSMWVNDTMAYLVGSFIGKTQLSKISPKKTWEGTIGGIILCILVIGFLFSYLSENSSVAAVHWYFIAAIASIFGTFGDLFESKLKRLAGVKDSGTMMPGHGGFLDRFDSLLVATPFVWLYARLFI